MKQSLRPFVLFALLAIGLAAINQTSAIGQTAATVTPLSAPIPLPAKDPMAPPLLRTRNASVLQMTGNWRFSLTHGAVGADETFVPRSSIVTASSVEGGNPPEHAFDDDTKTRWCADGASYPQWLQADLGSAQTVKAVDLRWERSGARYDYKLEGSSDGKAFVDLSGHSDVPTGSSDGTVTIGSPKAFRYFRVLITGAETGWASIRECKITLAGADGSDTIWKPGTQSVPDSVRDAFAAPAFSDADWRDLSVPSNWEMAGYSIPTYNSVDDAVGLYRRVVAVPASFAGKRILWRFDGVLDGAEIWINGRRAGYHESGYTAFDVDITDLIKPGEPNLFAVRVSKTTPSVDCETGDFQCMGGIYRENYLIALPPTHVRTLRVETTLDTAYRDAVLTAKMTIGGTPGEQISVSGEVVGSDGARIGAPALHGAATIGADGRAAFEFASPVAHPRLWSAEKPNLYYLVVTLSTPGKTAVERVEERFGFRQVEIKKGVVLWNGRPIKCTGVCRHDFWADKGFALTEANWRKDLDLMRGANINAIRTSHYNHAERFLELCDEMGFYILDEVPFCWINEKFSDPKFTPYLIQRANETIARDQNKPCVLAWSIGNENGHGSDGQAVIDRVVALDPTRPRFVSQMWSNGYVGQSFRDSHYPPPADIAGLVSGDDANSAPANFSENPHIFWQPEAHAYDPGVSDLWGDALQHAWDLIWPQPTILGSFIWEWQNQGIADKFPDKTRDFYEGPDHLRQENDKGVVDAYRNLKPEWAYVRMVYSPIAIGARAVTPANGLAAVPIGNRYSFTNLSELKCRWSAYRDGQETQHGERAIACEPGQTVSAHFPAPAGTTSLRLEFLRPDGSSVIGAKLPVDGVAVDRPAVAAASRGTLSVDDTGPDLRVRIGSNTVITFDRKTGTLSTWAVGKRMLVTGGTLLNLGEARKRGDAPKDYLYGPAPSTIEGIRLTWHQNADAVTVTAAGHAHGSGDDHVNLGSLFVTYTIRENGVVDVDWNLYGNAKTDSHAWEAGLQFALAKDLTRMRASRNSAFLDFPAGHQGAPNVQCSAADDAFRASKRELNYLMLTSSVGDGIVLAQSGGPLVGRAAATSNGILLFASREVAAPRDFSYPYVSEHDIVLGKDRSIGGSFCLYATQGGPSR